MKNLFVLILLVSTLNLIGQDVNPTQKGNLMLGGGGTMSYLTQFEEPSSGVFSLGLSPSIGWFLSDGFALGIGPTFQISSFFSEYAHTYLGIGMDLFLAKYFGIGIFIKGSTGYSLSHNFDSSVYGNEYSAHAIGIIPEVGYAFFLGPNVALELSLTDAFNIRVSEGSTSFYSTSSVKVGFQIFL